MKNNSDEKRSKFISSKKNKKRDIKNLDGKFKSTPLKSSDFQNKKFSIFGVENKSSLELAEKLTHALSSDEVSEVEKVLLIKEDSAVKTILTLIHSSIIPLLVKFICAKIIHITQNRLFSSPIFVSLSVWLRHLVTYEPSQFYFLPSLNQLYQLLNEVKPSIGPWLRLLGKVNAVVGHIGISEVMDDNNVDDSENKLDDGFELVKKKRKREIIDNFENKKFKIQPLFEPEMYI
jgi:hypothetical protein